MVPLYLRDLDQSAQLVKQTVSGWPHPLPYRAPKHGLALAQREVFLQQNSATRAFHPYAVPNQEPSCSRYDVSTMLKSSKLRFSREARGHADLGSEVNFVRMSTDYDHEMMGSCRWR